jgi:hypothetical protein
MVSSVIYKLTDPMIPEYSNMKIVTRLYNIANSRLKVTALTNFHKFRQGGLGLVWVPLSQGAERGGQLKIAL